jgi:two-component system, cell cycle sensor histidine kinase and response regulator CckA
MTFQPTPETRLTLDLIEELIVRTPVFAAEETVGDVFDQLRSCEGDFFGILDAGSYMGVVSKAQVGMLLSGRFGYALYAKHPICEHLLKDALALTPGDALLDMLDRALSRSGPGFHHDLAVVDTEKRYLGMLPMPTLVRLQNELIAEQTRRSAEQRHALQHRELQLFRSQERLRQSEGRFGILFENSPLGFALLSTSGHIEACNRMLAELLDLAPAAELPRFDECVAQKDRAALADIFHGFETSLHGETPRGMELRIETLHAEPRLARCDFHWIHETGQICLCVQDITSQRRLEQRLQQKEKSALLDSLAGGIAHELNNKLLPVLGFAELLEMRAGDNPELAGYCNIIRESTVEASELVSQLLQLSRPPALDPHYCDFLSIIQSAIGILRFRFRDSGCEPVLDLPGRPITIKADPAQLKQVVVNLCMNALDAMRDFSRRELHVNATEEDGGICLRVRDSGSGIAAEHLHRIFDPFFTTKGVQQGTGLGLSVCFSIVQQHGGTIEVETTGKDGTVFALWLPTFADAPRSAQDAESPSGESVALTAVPGELTVLVVDDEEFITRLVHESLRTRLGCRVVRAESAEEALEKLETIACDLVISDVRLPGKNGLDLLHELRRRWPRLAERFFFITGDAGSRELNILLHETGCPVLRKPFSMETLAVQTSAFLRGKMQDDSALASSSNNAPGLLHHPCLSVAAVATPLAASR